MTRYWLSVSLLLIMVITSVNSAFAFCPDMTILKYMPGQQIHNTVEIQTIPLAHHTGKNIAQEQTNSANSHANGHCQFHSCSDFNFSPLISLGHLAATHLFLNFSLLSPDSTHFAPGIRPPIQISLT